MSPTMLTPTVVREAPSAQLTWTWLPGKAYPRA